MPTRLSRRRNAIHKANLAAAVAIGITGTAFLLFPRASPLLYPRRSTHLPARDPAGNRATVRVRLPERKQPPAQQRCSPGVRTGCSATPNGRFGFPMSWHSASSSSPRTGCCRVGSDPRWSSRDCCSSSATRFSSTSSRCAAATGLHSRSLCSRSISRRRRWMILLDAHSRRERRTRWVPGACAALATLANLAWLNFAVALAVVAGALQFVRARRDPAAGTFLRNWLLPQLGTRSLLAAILIPVVAKLRAEQALYFGGDTGFWSDTVASLIESTLYAQPYALSALGPLTVAVAATLVAATGIALRGRRARCPGFESRGRARNAGAARRLRREQPAPAHQLLGTKFLLDRTALFLLPIFGLAGGLQLRRAGRQPPAAPHRQRSQQLCSPRWSRSTPLWRSTPATHSRGPTTQIPGEC